MHSYIFIGGRPAEQAAQLALRSLSALKAEYPETGAELTLRRIDLAAFPGALVTLAPAREFTPALFDSSGDEEHILFCFGRLAPTNKPSHGGMAQHVLRVVKRDGVQGARLLDGSFSAILIDRRNNSVEAFTDLVGMRSLRYARVASGIVIAAHDLALVAAGAATGSMDLDSLAACVACDWSIGGHSLLRGVETSDGRYRVSWRPGETQRRFEPRVSIPLGRQREYESTLQEFASELEHGAKEFVQDRSVTRFSLTAGKDSRLVLALLRAFAKGELRAQTNGSPDSEDVVVAKRLARIVGVRHEVVPHRAPTADSFASMTGLLALSMNGLTNAKRALAPLPEWDPNRDVLVGGEGGEIYTGFLYGAARGLATAQTDGTELADRLLSRRFLRHQTLVFGDPGRVVGIRQRLIDTLDELSLISRNAHDLLDLFYLYERYAQWGALGERNSWGRRWTPFNNTRAIRLAFQLPAPIGLHCTIHELLIRRHLPVAAYLTPINGSAMLFLSGPGRSKTLARRVLKELATRAPWRRHYRSPDAPPAATREQIFATKLADYLKDVLLSRGSVAIDLFGATATERIISRHMARLDQLAPLGFLVTGEAFRQQCQRLVRVAAH